MEKILVIDVGTTRLKVACVNEFGNIRNIVSSVLPKNSVTEQDPELWFKETLNLITKIVELEKDNKFISIVLTGNMHALLAVDKNGESLLNAWLWNDLRASKESEFLNLEYGPIIKEKFFNSSIPGFPLPKLLYLKKKYPETFKSIEKILQPKDFIAFRLSGNTFTDFTDASGTLMFNLKEKRWDVEFLSNFGLDRAILPDVVNSHTKIGTLKKEIAKLTGLNWEIPVIIGAGDLATASLGSGVNENNFVLVLGTAGQILTVDSQLIKELENKVFAFSYVKPEQYLYLGTVPAGGYSFDWFSKLLNVEIEKIFEFAKSASGNSKMLFLPFIQGTGTPHMKYEPHGAFLNISHQDSTPEFCRSIVEGVIFSLKESSDIIEKFSKEKRELVLQSLASKNELIQSIISSLHTTKKIFLSTQSEASIIGAAIIGAVGSGIYDSFKKAKENMISVVEADIENKEVESGILERFKMYQDYAKILLGRDRK